jgi:hypothetical protein
MLLLLYEFLPPWPSQDSRGFLFAREIRLARSVLSLVDDKNMFICHK